MKKIICFFFGHDWEEVDVPDHQRREYLTWNIKICNRCNKKS